METLEQIRKQLRHLSELERVELEKQKIEHIKEMKITKDASGNIVSLEGYVYNLDGALGVEAGLTSNGIYMPTIYPIKSAGTYVRIKLMVIDDGLDFETMRLDTQPGAKVVFTGENGTEYDQDEARKVLNIGQEYTLKYISVGSSSSHIGLEEIPGNNFNSVMFNNKSSAL